MIECIATVMKDQLDCFDLFNFAFVIFPLEVKRERSCTTLYINDLRNFATGFPIHRSFAITHK